MTGNESTKDLSGEHLQGGDGAHKRESALQSAADTVGFVKDTLSDKSIVLRDEDKASTRVLSVFLLIGLAAICVAAFEQDWNWLRTRLGAGGFTPFRPINLVVLGGVDVLYFLPLAWFVLQRMGILRTMPKRHALICFQLMAGASILTALICVNIAVIILLVCLGNHMQVLM